MEEEKKESWLVKALTPKNTEEIKPGLFVQQRGNGYRVIAPSAWDGKINWKNFVLGLNWKSSFMFFVILMFIVWSYKHDNAVFIAQDKMIKENPLLFCKNVTEAYSSANQLTNLSNINLTLIGESQLAPPSPVQNN